MLFKNLHENINGNDNSPKFYNDTPELRTPQLYESFDGGMFRGKAGAELGKLSIYHLLRGLEIETSKETYAKLSQNIPSCKAVFDESKAESTMATEVVTSQIDFIKNKITPLESKFEKNSDIIAIIDELKKSGTKLEIFKETSEKMDIISYIDKVIGNIQKDNSGLKSGLYDGIDKLNLSEIEDADFSAISKNYVSEPIKIDDLISSKNPIQRISGFLEKALEIIAQGGEIAGIKFIEYAEGDGGFKFLKGILPAMTGSDDVKINAFRDTINSVSDIIIKSEIQLPELGKNVIVPSLQSFYLTLISCLSIKLIAKISSSNKQEGSGKTEDKTETTPTAEATQGKFSQEIIKKATSISQVHNELKDVNFFESKTIFSNGKKYTSEEDLEIIKSLKLFFIKIGLIDRPETDTDYINKKRFGSDLENAIKQFQEIQKLSSDGKIGKNTKAEINAFLESLKSNFKLEKK